MKIVVDTNLFTKTPADEYSRFFYKLLKELLKSRNGIDITLIASQPHAPEFSFGANLKVIITGSVISNPVQHRYWYDIKLPSILKKQKADLFISPTASCSLRTRVSQCIMLPDLAFLHSPSLYKKTRLFFLKKYLRKALAKVNTAVVFSRFSRAAVTANYAVEGQKLKVLPVNAGDPYPALTEEEKEAIKTRYTDGMNYFIYADSMSPLKNVTSLLKAFSIFKKRQKTNWKLILASGREDNKLMTSLRNYKFRDDVVNLVVNDGGEYRCLLGGAYAMVHPSPFEDNSITALQAIVNDLPLIAARGSAFEEMAGEAALYTDVHSHQDIADKMMLLYKDESLRSNLIKKGRLIVNELYMYKAGAAFWTNLLSGKQ